MITGFHHVGCLVQSIEEAISDYSLLHPGGNASAVFEIEDQKVRVCFYEICGMNVEFVSPSDNTTSLYKLLQKNGSFYHIGVFTDDMESELKRLEEGGYRKINQFRSPAFENRFCAFLLNNEMHLIELIESGKPAAD